MNFQNVETPCYIIDEDLIEKNLKILKGVMDKSGCKILLAQKAFSNYALYPLVNKYLCGATASGLYEAKLYNEYRSEGCENHIFSPAFKESDIDEILDICDHIVFNSMRQLALYGKRAKEAGLQVGLRVNPEKSTQEGHAIYDPCASGSRLGCTLAQFEKGLQEDASLLGLLDGIHFHTLCEQDSDALKITLDALEEKFSTYMYDMKWINFGGGHHITREGYDVATLLDCITHIQNKYDVQVYLEPGEAIALRAGYLVTTVLEMQEKQANPVIVDTSASCHMPDVIEMPYRPPLQNSGEANEFAYTYTLGGPTCLAGDIIGTYSFTKPLEVGQRLVFEDMAIYSMVKNNTFNGMPLPNIYIQKDGVCRLWKQFTYQDFKDRL